MNKTIFLPYGKGALTLNVPEENLKAVMHSSIAAYATEKTQAELVEVAIAHPHGGLPLRERVRGKKKIVVISSDHTRPVPSRLLMPIILREIRAGNPDADIAILVATGCHRSPTQQELLDRYGEDIVAMSASSSITRTTTTALWIWALWLPATACCSTASPTKRIS